MNINLTRKSAIHNPAKKSAIRNGFSLVELLVAIAIIALLITIGVGVGQKVMTAGNVKVTEANMAIIMNAIEYYQELDTDATPYEPPDDTNDRPNRQSRDLYTALTADNEVQAKLASLPADAVESSSPGHFLDKFGKEIWYDATGGLGGTPLLTSAGPDGYFGTEDDIRSDK